MRKPYEKNYTISRTTIDRFSANTTLIGKTADSGSSHKTSESGILYTSSGIIKWKEQITKSCKIYQYQAAGGGWYAETKIQTTITEAFTPYVLDSEAEDYYKDLLILKFWFSICNRGPPYLSL